MGIDTRGRVLMGLPDSSALGGGGGEAVVPGGKAAWSSIPGDGKHGQGECVFYVNVSYLKAFFV